jgi:hypothetical protein
MSLTTQILSVEMLFDRNKPPPALRGSISGDPYISKGEVYLAITAEDWEAPLEEMEMAAFSFLESHPKLVHVGQFKCYDPGAAPLLIDRIIRFAGERAVSGNFPDDPRLLAALDQAGFRDYGDVGEHLHFVQRRAG